MNCAVGKRRWTWTEHEFSGIKMLQFNNWLQAVWSWKYLKTHRGVCQIIVSFLHNQEESKNDWVNMWTYPQSSLTWQHTVAEIHTMYWSGKMKRRVSSMRLVGGNFRIPAKFSWTTVGFSNCELLPTQGILDQLLTSSTLCGLQESGKSPQQREKMSLIQNTPQLSWGWVCM